MQNYYEILGVERNASQNKIKTAYRRLAKQYHPDTAPDDASVQKRFQEIQEAYATLSDMKKRAIYDYYGHDFYKSSYGAQQGNMWTPYGDYAEHDPDEEYECDGSCGGDGGCGGDCGGDCGGHHHEGHSHGHSHTHKTKDGHCGACEMGQEDGEGPTFFEEEEYIPPPMAVRVAVKLTLAETMIETVKEATYTERYEDPDPDAKPHFKIRDWHFKVRIPACSHDHQFYPLKDNIDPSSEFAAYMDTQRDKTYVIIILLIDDPNITRRDYHLYIEHEIDFSTLVLGGKITVPSFDGDADLIMPPGFQTHRYLRLPGRGLWYPPLIGGRGDLHVNFRVRIPETLTEEQRQAVEHLRDVFAAAPN